jgi:hypothetical protein
MCKENHCLLQPTTDIEGMRRLYKLWVFPHVFFKCFSEFKHKRNNPAEIIPKDSGIEIIPAYLYEQSNRLALMDKT